MDILTTDLMRKIRRIEIRTRRMVNDSFAGEYRSIFKGLGMEFDEVRQYNAGDDVRSIDWNVTARMGQPFVKRFMEERELTVILIVDASSSGDFGSVRRFKRELAAELAAVLAFSATTNNDKVGLLIFTDQVELYIPPHKGRRHVLRLIRDLLAYKPQGKGTDIKLALDTINQIMKRRSIVFLLSDFLVDAESYRKSLFITNRKHDVIAVDLHDPLEKEIPPVGLLTLEDAETGKIIYSDTSDALWREAFTEQVRRNEAEKENALSQAGVDCINIDIETDYVTALTSFFQKRARRIRH